MRRHLVLFIFLSGTLGCNPATWLEISEPETVHAALEAPCDAPVNGTNGIDIELDYLPHVVKCENGAASYEALKAQAVAARSYLYYKIENYGQIADGQSDQVYSCGRSPSEIHYDAVADTAGLHLVFDETLVSTFYVAGAHPSDEITCIATADDPEDFDPGTERFVTYNWGMYGNDVQQTTLGWIDDNNLANRGCMSQNGADCLSNQGWGYEDILRFYYGMDIGFSVAEGECLEDIPCDEDPDCDEETEDTQGFTDGGDEENGAGSGENPNGDETPPDIAEVTNTDLPGILTIQNDANEGSTNIDQGKDLPPSVVSSCSSAAVWFPGGLLTLLFLFKRRKKRH